MRLFAFLRVFLRENIHEHTSLGTKELASTISLSSSAGGDTSHFTSRPEHLVKPATLRPKTNHYPQQARIASVDTGLKDREAITQQSAHHTPKNP